MIDRYHDDRVYFQDTQSHPFHRSFAVDALAFSELEQPFLHQYFSPTRRFVLGALSYHSASDAWIYEMAPYDNAGPDLIQLALDRVGAAIQFRSALAFHAGSATQQAVAASLPFDVNVVSTEELLHAQDYRALTPGEAWGRVRLLGEDQAELGSLERHDIAVLTRVPETLPPVAGIVTVEGHSLIAESVLRAKARGVPHMQLRSAFTALSAFAERWVQLTITPDEYQLRFAPQAERALREQEPKVAPLEIVDVDVASRELIDLSQSGLSEAGAVGGHAAHLAEVSRAEHVAVSPAFVVPMAYYLDFSKGAGVDVELDRLLENPVWRSDAAVRQNGLSSLQSRIRSAPIDDELVDRIWLRAETLFPEGDWVLQASSNAADVAGHAGLGVLGSVHVRSSEGREALMDGLRGVWASLWSLPAFDDRTSDARRHRSSRCGDGDRRIREARRRRRRWSRADRKSVR